jgi:plastocyanin
VLVWTPGSRSRRAAVAVALAMAIAACSSGSTATPPAASPSGAAPGGAGSAVTIQNFAFDPASLTVAVGSTVTWTNRDSVGHTVTADDGSFDSKTIANGDTFSHTFSQAGTFAYHCSIHTTMKATIVVQ